MLLYTAVLVPVLMAMCHGSLAEKMMRPKFKDIKFWSDEKFVSHKVVYDNSDPHLNFSMEVHQELHDVDIHVEVRITNKQDPYYNTNLNTTLNVCRILGFANKSPVGRFVHGFIREFGNIVETCPIAKGSYFINKFWWPEDPTTAMLPELEFEIIWQAMHVDASKKRTLIMNDHFGGDFVVQDVNNLKPGIFAMLPKIA
uniref:Uncharacterized protein, isoform A n=1 Tax=Drosophila melanogaster TaxID=7227 RepID=Q9VNS8_DROME|nr:uncharacterized protein Dmel_CG14456, isoform A [Drosophila melanogaster]AAF51842.1 uncharacterized protein Dmel_CG14456, isoform A [Drosophila melanogaster]|eukprot:NP_649403.1 uncharacterized protein Dmel_CG14456, isoform A [Drosophila melanogaster]